MARRTPRVGQEWARSTAGCGQEYTRSGRGSVGALSGAYKADEVGRKPKSLIMILLNMLIRHIVMGSDVFKGVFNICTKARFASKPHSDAPETPLLAHAIVGHIVNLETLTCATRAGKLVPPPASTAPGRNPRCSKAPPPRYIQTPPRRPQTHPSHLVLSQPYDLPSLWIRLLLHVSDAFREIITCCHSSETHRQRSITAFRDSWTR